MLAGRWKIHPFAYRGDEAINLDQIQPYHSHYGAGGVILHLFQDNAPIKERSAALFALRECPLSQINPLIHELLPDTSDDIRLLAFNILEGQESSIMSRIEALLLRLKTVPDGEPLIKAQCQKSLALLHWELIHHHLIEIELEETIINKAIASALSALTVLSDDAVLWALLGKLYQHRQQDLLAVEAFETAMSCHSAPTEVLPYLAEIRFKQGDYSAIQALLSQSDALLDMMQIAPVKRFWGNG